MKKPNNDTADALTTFATQPLDEIGQGVILAATPAAKNILRVVTFVVDAHCLGVRQVSFATMPAAVLLNKILPVLGVRQSVRAISPAVALGIIKGAAAYAKDNGFDAPANFPEGLAVFGNLETAPVPFAFGKNGKPFYTQQENDTADFAENVITKLEKKFGENGFGSELRDFEEEWSDATDTDDDAAEE